MAPFTHPRCRLPELAEIKSILAVIDVNVRDIYTRIDPSRLVDISIHRNRINLCIKRQKFVLNVVRFLFGCFVVKHRNNLSMKDFIKEYWMNVHDVKEVAREFKTAVAAFMRVVNLFGIFGPLIFLNEPFQHLEFEESEVDSSAISLTDSAMDHEV